MRRILRLKRLRRRRQVEKDLRWRFDAPSSDVLRWRTLSRPKEQTTKVLPRHVLSCLRGKTQWTTRSLVSVSAHNFSRAASQLILRALVPMLQVEDCPLDERQRKQALVAVLHNTGRLLQDATPESHRLAVQCFAVALRHASGRALLPKAAAGFLYIGTFASFY
ncbi:MAG: hypothetical protein MHM6MM_006007, partial [Cercozoa sp. M6MM]